MGSFAVSGLFFWLSKNAPLKKRLLPIAGVTIGCLFLGTALALGFPLKSLCTFAPLIAFGVWLNVRAIQFCLSCGATVRGGAFLTRSKFCPRCGASLADKH